ncbi:MAG TPA: AMP-binding protein [Acidimicrobiales bacterium]|nr:AMP-binding protein [Acidimicrobiales bacterium]
MSLDDPTTPTSTLAELISRRALDRGDATYLLAAHDERTISYAELAEECEHWRTRFRDAGVEAGDRVGLGVRDPLAFATAFLGGMTSNLWMAPMDPTTESASPERFATHARRVAMSMYLADADSLGQVTLRPLDAASGRSGNEGSGGVVMASSGTTGTPKIVRLPTDQLLATAALVSAHHGLTPADRGFNPLPLFHINAEVVGLLATLSAGASLVLDDRFHRTNFWDVVDGHEVTWINAVPAIIARLTPLGDGERVAHSVRFVRSASAPLPTALATSFQTQTGLAIIETYGMTEAASQICANPLDGPRVGSVGRPVGVHLRVVSDTGAQSPAHGVGQVEITGPTVISEYDAPGYEDRFTTDGWLRTNDLGYLDEDGYLFLVGRSDDVINRGGEKIFPREIEEVLLANPDVEVAAVVGEADEVFGQVPIAYVQLSGVDASTAIESILPTVKELREALVVTFSRSRRPKTLRVIERLPVHATGKIQKGALGGEQVPILLSESVG